MADVSQIRSGTNSKHASKQASKWPPLRSLTAASSIHADIRRIRSGTNSKHASKQANKQTNKQKLFQNSSKMHPKTSQNSLQNRQKSTLKSIKIVPRTPPKTRSPKSHENDTKMFPKRRPKGGPKGSQKSTISIHFLHNFLEGSRNPPKHLRADSGAILAPFWLHFWSHLGSRIEEG